MRKRQGCSLTSHTLYRYFTYSVCCLLLLLGGCATSVKPKSCTPRLTLHLLYPSSNPHAVTYKNPVDEVLYLSPALLECQHIDNVFYIYSMDGSGPTIRLDLTAQGQAILSQQTSEHVRGNLAILIDGQLLATPIIQMPIDGNSLLINGITDEVVAKSAVNSMKAESNIGRYQLSESKRLEAPVLFQTGMPLARYTPQTSTTAANQQASSEQNASAAPTPAPRDTSESQSVATAPPALLADTASPTAPASQTTSPLADHEIGLGHALTKAQLLAETRRKLQAMSSNHYTVQLLATPNYPVAQALLQEPGIKGSLYLYRTWRNNQEWYVVVTGEFSTLSEARAAASGEKMAQFYHDAWVKSVRKVHQEIKIHKPTPAPHVAVNTPATPRS